MDMATFSGYLVAVVVVICVGVGYIIKNVLPGEKVNKFIPLLLGVLGVVLNLWASGWQMVPEVVAGGLVSGLAATGGYEAVKQIFGKKE